MKKQLSENEERIRRDPPEVMTLVEASIYLSISDRMLRSMVKAGTVPHFRVGNLIRIKLEDVKDMV
jgi:excisionase family DNA binding protein